MKDTDKTKVQLINELGLLRQRISQMETSETEPEQMTEKAAGEKTLKRRPDRLESWANEVPFGICNTDLKGKITYVNKNFEEVSGYSWEDIVGKNGFKLGLFPGETYKLLAKRMKEKLKGMPPSLLEVQFKCKDERWIWASLEGKLLKEQGMPTGIQIIAKDITDRRRAEEDARANEARYHELFSNMHSGVAVYEAKDGGEDFVFKDFNRAGERMDKVKKEDIVDKSVTEIFPVVKDFGLFDVFQRVWRTGKPEHFPVSLYQDERISGWRDNYVYKLPSGEIVAVYEDVTERGEAEDILQRERGYMKSILDNVPDMIVALNQNREITYVNSAIAQFAGVKPSEVVGKPIEPIIREFDSLIPESTDEMIERVKTRLQTGEITSNVEIEMRNSEGEMVPCIYSASGIKSSGGEILGEVIIIRDISERNQEEKGKRELERKAMLSSHLASVGEMASGIAHEINNPLTGVIGYSHLLAQREDIPEDIREDIRAIDEGAQRVANIVKGMLTFARQHKPERKYIDINEIVASTIDLRSYALRTASIEVTTFLDSELPAIVADSNQLQQVFLNILVNAETEMKLAHGKGKLSIKTEKIDNSIRISFKDDGPGIARKNLNRIFDPFFTTRKVGQGTGLGLSVCHGIIAEHDGRIYAESKSGRGATFIIELPIVTKSEQLELAETDIEQAQKVARTKILVVDDEPMVLSFLSQLLSGEGHKVDTVDNGEDALKMVEADRYNLILLDIKMPGVSGIEFYKATQKIAKSLARRIVFITGDVMGTDTQEFIARTKVPYITKPFDAEQLNREINRILTDGA